MGKAKRVRMRNRSSNPTGLQSVKETEMASQESPVGDSVSTRVQTLVENLQSPSAEERECCCSTIAYLVGNNQTDTVSHFLRAGVLRVIAPMLMDESIGVRKVALGVLRNLTVVGGPQTCWKMVEQDVMTSLVALIQTYTGAWYGEEQPSTQTDVFYEAVSLLWNLCEVSSTAVNIFNQQNLLPILLPTLFPGACGSDVAIATAQCLYTVTEDNATAATYLADHEALRQMQGYLAKTSTPDPQLRTPEQLLVGVLIAGILYNVSCSELSSFGGAVIQNVIHLLVEILEVDIKDRLRQLCEMLDSLQPPDEPRDTGHVTGGVEAEILAADVAPPGECTTQDQSPDGSTTENGEHDNIDGDTTTDPEPTSHFEIDMCVGRLKRIINAQQIAMEMTANLCCPNDEGDDWADVGESDASSDDLSPGDADVTAQTADIHDSQECLCLSQEVQKAVVQSGLVQKVFERLRPVEESVLGKLREHENTKPLTESLHSLQERALLCAGNAVAALELSEVGGAMGMVALRTTLADLTAALWTARDTPLLEGATCALRATCEKLSDLDTAELQQLAAVTGSDLEFLYKIGTACDVAAVRVNVTQIIANFGLQLVDTDNFAVLKGVAEYLSTVVTTDSTLWVVAEALDAIFDVFAEDKTDPVVKKIGLVARLQGLVPQLKQKYQQQKRHLGEHRGVIDTARSNLSRFIKYKSGRPGAT